jgi:drug/metabolite transporter (DMT)-like permease
MKMEQLLPIVVIVAAGLSVAVGDMLIKKVAMSSGSMTSAMLHPLMAAALAFYVLQIVLFAYVFVRRWELGIVALLQMVFYSAACVLMGRFLFGERVTFQQGIGMLLAFLGAVLMNGGR